MGERENTVFFKSCICGFQFQSESRNRKYAQGHEECSKKMRKMKYRRRKKYIENASQFRLEANSRKMGRMVVNYFKVEWECRICKMKDGLEVHHRNINPLDNRIENLWVLCKKCHSDEHSRLSKEGH